jgi:N-formylglutamate amidohydrolase
MPSYPPCEVDRQALDSLFESEQGGGPILVLSLHAGHAVRPSLLPCFELSESERLREEDPYTDQWTAISPNRIVPRRSRFEVDLNRPPERAVYRKPEDAWGLRIWKEPPSDAEVAKNMREYRKFYAYVLETLNQLEERHGRFVVLDLHSYNHRRGGPHAEAAAAADNPDVNVGTGTMDRARWAPVVERFMRDLRGQTFCGRRLDVRENVRFKGGYFPQWVHQHFPVTGCALAVEFKKTFMDEWSGVADLVAVQALGELLGATLPGLAEELSRR